MGRAASTTIQDLARGRKSYFFKLLRAAGSPDEGGRQLDQNNRRMDRSGPGRPWDGSGAGRQLETEFAHRDLQVGPRFLFLARIAKKEGRVVSDDELAAAEGVDAAAEAG